MSRVLNKPLVLTDDLILRLADAIRAVLVMYRACDLIGLHRQNLDNWRKKAESLPGSIYEKLFIEIRKAQAEKIQIFLGNIENRKSNWQANAWLLERCFREDFGADAGVIADIINKNRQVDMVLENIRLGRDINYVQADSSEEKEDSKI